MKTYSILILLVTGIIFSASGQDDLQRVAQQAVEDLRQLVSKEEFGGKNLPSPDALANARTGNAVMHHVIELEALRSYTPQTDPNRIIKEIGRVTVPVTSAVDSRVIATIELDRNNEKWQIGELGNQQYMRIYEELRQQLDLRPEDARLVRVPTFNLYFLATGERMALLSDQAYADIPPRELQATREVLRLLVPVAQSYNGLPW